jgi:sulfur carrier protein ThiS adenylyltransferase
MALRILERFARQELFVPRERLLREEITIIGVGGIGRQVALQLAALGAPSLQLIDFGEVVREQITSQGYLTDDIGRPKAEATGDLCHQTEHLMAVEEIHDRFRPSQVIGTCIFCCVDSSAARVEIWNSVESRCRFWGDGRLYGEIVRAVVAADSRTRQHYSNALSQKADAETEEAANSTIYAAALAAALLVHQFTRYLRGLPLEADTIFNFTTSQLTLISPTSS